MTLKDIEAARPRQAGVVLRTPLIYSHTLSRASGREVFLKLENLQTTGSFKLRGAINRLTLLKERGEGVQGGGRLGGQPRPGRGLCRGPVGPAGHHRHAPGGLDFQATGHPGLRRRE